MSSTQRGITESSTGFGLPCAIFFFSLLSVIAVLTLYAYLARSWLVFTEIGIYAGAGIIPTLLGLEGRVGIFLFDASRIMSNH